MRFLRGSVSVSRVVHRNPSVCSLKLAATFPFREDIILLRSFNFGYYYELLYAPCVASDISTTASFSRRVACDKLGLSVKGAGIAVGDD